jgi:glycosyltransferase involved in cell wall biosynthesis
MTTNFELDHFFSLNSAYSTTRCVTKKIPTIITSSNSKMKFSLFLSENKNRKGQGGLRTKGYFKKSIEGKPLITIITVVFNGEDFIKKTIDSILLQTYSNIEYIIIDGGSTDKTVEIIRSNESQIDYWVSEPDGGIYDAMNKSQLLSSGDFVWFLNAGDEISDNNILNEVSLEIDNSHNYIYAGIHIINVNGSIKKTIIPPIPLLINLMIKGMYVSHQSFIPRRNILSIYDVKYKLIADQKWIIDCMKYGDERGFYFNRPLSRYMTGGISDLKSIDCIIEKISMVKTNFPSYYFKNLPKFLLELCKEFIKKLLK